jgi:hypothetical protein
VGERYKDKMHRKEERERWRRKDARIRCTGRKKEKDGGGKMLG